MSTITRKGFVKFTLDGHSGNKIPFVVRTGPKMSVTSRKKGNPTKDRNTNRTCACGDIYCNHILKFLGTLITSKCSYQHPDMYNNNSNKQFRCQKIHHQVVTWRRTRNDLFEIPVPAVPPTGGRFNEIHYPLLFLMNAVKRTQRRIPESMDVEEARETQMFKKELLRYYTHNRKERVVVVPTLNAHTAIQVYNMF